MLELEQFSVTSSQCRGTTGVPEKYYVKRWSQNNQSQMVHKSKGFSTSVDYIVISFVGWKSETLPYLLVATVAFRNVSLSNRNLAIGK